MRGRGPIGRGGAGGGGAGGGGGGGRLSGKAVREELGLQQASLSEWFSLMQPYFFPSFPYHRIFAVSCYACLILSKACMLAGPAILGSVTDDLMRKKVPVDKLVLFASLRFLSSFFDESQRLLYLRVKEVAALELDCRVFKHLHELSYGWHVSKSTGVVLQAMKRGSSAAEMVVEMLFMRLVPTVIEMLVLVWIFAEAYGSPVSSLVLLISFITYFVATFILTKMRMTSRARANLAGDDATSIATESMTGFEVVKAFSAESYELKRFADATARMQEAGRMNQGSLVLLNLVQSMIMRLALFGVLLVTSYEVVNNRVSIGAFVALQTWVMQLFQPLSWLGSLYMVIQTSLTDTLNVAALLKEQQSVKDAVDAKPLVLRDRIHGATIEVKALHFAYPEARDRLNEARESQREREKREKEAQIAARLQSPLPIRLLLHLGDSVSSLWQGIVSSLPSLSPKSGAVILEETSQEGWGKGGSVSSPTATNAISQNSVGVDSIAIQINNNDGVNIQNVDSGEGGGKGGGKRGEGTGLTRQVLSDVSFTIKPGKTTAIVGSTGSGKSTISRLLFRYYDPDSGSISIDGEDIRNVQQISLRSSIGIVPQDAVLFNDTIKVNIAYGRLGATDAEVIEAAKAAQLWPFIETLKEGLECKVGERGLKLSGGEKQRVAIARTLLKNPPILVLDEATSALDSITESSVQEAITRAKQGRTVLTIAHRLSTIRDADEILVLEHGRIVERGSHDVLLGVSNGKYAALWNQQLSSQHQQPGLLTTAVNAPVDAVDTTSSH
jgi:ABC-type transport system involved in Fe-S cluster assembly fused permease/ATPase subunit